MNKAILIGNLGAKIKMHYFENGNCVGNVSLATSETYTDKKTGEKKTVTEWHKLVFHNKLAETIEKYTDKGSKIAIEGKLKNRQWVTPDGSKRISTEVIVKNFEFLSTKANDNQATPEQTTNTNNPDFVSGEPEDDLPF